MIGVQENVQTISKKSETNEINTDLKKTNASQIMTQGRKIR